MEYSIGDLSKITRISGKTLHHYHQEGLVIPTRIDKFTHHRYYDETCLQRVEAVVRFRRLGISTQVTKEILAGHKDAGRMLEQMQAGLKEKEHPWERFGIPRDKISAFFHNDSKVERIAGKLEISALSDLYAAGERFHGNTTEIGNHLSHLEQVCGTSIAGQPVILFHDDHQYHDEMDLECCLPVDRSFSSTGVTCQILRGTRAVCVRYEGFYEGIWMGYRKIIDYLNRHHLAVQSPSREIWRHYHPTDARLEDDPVCVDIQFLIGDPNDPEFTRNISRPGYGIDARFDL